MQINTIIYTYTYNLIHLHTYVAKEGRSEQVSKKDRQKSRQIDKQTYILSHTQRVKKTHKHRIDAMLHRRRAFPLERKFSVSKRPKIITQIVAVRCLFGT